MEILRPAPVKVRDLDAPIHLHAIGDIHVGEAGCTERGAAEQIARAAEDPSAIAILMGDLGGFIAADDRRWDPGSVDGRLTIADLDDWGQAVVERVVNLLAPLKGRIVGSLEGNHEASWRARGKGHVARWIADRLGCPFLGYSTVGDLAFRAGRHERRISLHATHGAGCAITIGAKMNRLVRAMNDFPSCDLVLYAHVHVGAEYLLPRIALGPDGHLHEHLQYGAITGSYLRTYAEGHSGYGERGGYPPAAIGHRVIEIVPRRGVVSTHGARP